MLPACSLKRPLLSAFWVLSECLLNSLMLSECADVSDLIIRFLQWSWARINICFSHYFLKYAGLLSSVQYLVTSDAMSPGSPARARRLLVTTSGPASVLTLRWGRRLSVSEQRPPEPEPNRHLGHILGSCRAVKVRVQCQTDNTGSKSISTIRQLSSIVKVYH